MQDQTQRSQTDSDDEQGNGADDADHTHVPGTLKPAEILGQVARKSRPGDAQDAGDNGDNGMP